MSDMAWETDVRLAIGGDREAFARVVRALSRELYRMARTLLNSDSDIADAIQEAILQAYRSVTKVREPEFFKTWFIRILIRECGRVKRRLDTVTLPSGYANEAHASMQLPDLDLQAAVERLEEPPQTTVRLHYWADLPVERVAALTEVPEGTVKSRLYRARKQLAAWLEDADGEGDVGYERC